MRRRPSLHGTIEQALFRDHSEGDKDQVANLRQAQRTWIKHRDEGAKLYISLFINLKIYGSSVIADYLGEFAGLGT